MIAFEGDLEVLLGALVDLEGAVEVVEVLSRLVEGLFKAVIRLDWSMVFGGSIGFLGLPLGRLVGATVGCSMANSPMMVQ